MLIKNQLSLLYEKQTHAEFTKVTNIYSTYLFFFLSFIKVSLQDGKKIIILHSC